MELRWFRDGDHWVATEVGSLITVWRIERIPSDARKGYGWYVTEPINGGYYDTLSQAKFDCQRATNNAARAACEDKLWTTTD